MKTSRQRIFFTVAVALLAVAALYFLIPKLLGLQQLPDLLAQADPAWLVLALVLTIACYASYVALLHLMIGDLSWPISYQITMAGLAATLLVSSGGLGGILLTYWALRSLNLGRRESSSRIFAFLVVLYSVYMVSLIVFGIFLRAGILEGAGDLGLTVIPAFVAGFVVLTVLALALFPPEPGRKGWFARAGAAASVGVRRVFELTRRPRELSIALSGAVAFWALQIAVLWASLRAFDLTVPVGPLVQGFFVGMVANLFPLTPGGIGAVDGGLIGTLVLFGQPAAEVFAGVLTFRVLTFWLVIPFGVVALFQLRRSLGGPGELGGLGD
jgi:uncharacterized membrane protein YbhN (UPF0104 family)